MKINREEKHEKRKKRKRRNIYYRGLRETSGPKLKPKNAKKSINETKAKRYSSKS